MIRGHRRGEGAGGADANLYLSTAVERNELYRWRSACALQDTGWRSSLGAKLNLVFPNSGD